MPAPLSCSRLLATCTLGSYLTPPTSVADCASAIGLLHKAASAAETMRVRRITALSYVVICRPGRPRSRRVCQRPRRAVHGEFHDSADLSRRVPPTATLGAHVFDAQANQGVARPGSLALAPLLPPRRALTRRVCLPRGAATDHE